MSAEVPSFGVMGLHCAGKRLDGTFFMAADMVQLRVLSP